MSLFIGKDNNNDNILHITKGETSLNDMKSTSLLVSTLFHSKLPIMTAKKFEAVSITYINTYTPYYFNAKTGKRYDIEFHVEAIDYLLSNSNILVYDIVADGNVVFDVGNYSKANGICQWFNSDKSISHNHPFIGAKYARISKSIVGTVIDPVSVQLIVYNIDVLGNLINTFSDTDRSIHITDSAITIGTDNMLDNSYVSNTIINTSDYTFTDVGNATRQLLNSSGASGTVEIKNTTSGIEIYNGNVKVFDTTSEMVVYKLYETQTLHKNYGDFGCGPTYSQTWKLFDIPSYATDIFLTIQTISATIPATLNFSLIMPTTSTYYMFALYPIDTSTMNRVYIYIDVTAMTINLYITPARGINFYVGEANYTLVIAGRV